MKINSKFVTDKVVEVARAIAAKNVKRGWQVNPDDKVVRGIVKGIIRCEGDCPCDNHSKELQCPCSGYRDEDHCCCNLYVKIQ